MFPFNWGPFFRPVFSLFSGPFFRPVFSLFSGPFFRPVFSLFSGPFIGRFDYPTALFGDCTGRISTVGVNSKLFFIAQTRLCLSVEAIVKKRPQKRPKKCTENQPKKRGPIHPKISARTLPKSPPDAATINAGRCLRPTDFHKWPQDCPGEESLCWRMT